MKDKIDNTSSRWDIRTLVFLSMLFILSSCNSSLCGNELINEVSSPDGKYVASVFERSCGATTSFIRVVSLRLASKKFAPEDYDSWVFTIHDRANVNVTWVTFRQLEISNSKSQDQPTQIKKWRDVTVSYK